MKLALVPQPGELVFLPPSDLTAERSTLSACLFDPSALPRVVDFLKPEHFFSEAHRRIYEAMVGVRAEDKPVDTTTTATWLRERGRLEQVGGWAYLTACIDATPAVTNVRSHAEAVFEAWRVRQCIAAAQRIAAVGYTGAGDVQTFADDAAAVFLDLARRSPSLKHERNIDVLKRAVREMQAALKGDPGRPRGIPTGLVALDALTGGLHSGHKFTLAALPRVGKTALGLQIGMHVASLGIGVLFFSAEMGRDELADRQIAHRSGIDGTRIRAARQKPTLSPEEWTQMSEACTHCAKLPLTVDDSPALTVDDVATRAKVHSERSVALDKAPLGLLVVDYVQRLAPPRALADRGKPEQVEYSTKRLKTLARELKIPVLELAQQRDLECDKRTGKRPPPQLGDVAWCKHVDKEADETMYLWRPNENDGSRVTASLRKQRGGDEGEFQLAFDRKCGRFTDARLEADRRYVDGGQ